MAKGIPAGQASFTLKLNDQLTSKLSKIGSSIKNTMGRFGGAAKAGGMIAVKAIAAIGEAAGGAVRSILALGRAFASYGDKFGKMATRTGIGAEALQELGYAAEISGTSIDSLAQALFRARRRIGNMALGGGGPAKRALETLGLDAKKLSRMAPEAQFKVLITALKGVANEAERNQLAFEIFGDNFRDIQPLIAASAESMDEMRERANRLGLVLSGDEIRQAEALTDAFYELGRVVKMTFVKLGAAFGPTLTLYFTGLAESIADITNKIVSLGGGLTVLGAQIKLTVVEMLLAVIENIANIFSKLPGGIGAMFNAIVAGLKTLRTQAQKDLTAAQRAAQNKPGEGEKEDGVVDSDLENMKIPGIHGRSSNILSGFAAGMASMLGDPSQRDPKAEEKEMVRLLGDIADAGPLAVQPGP
jgi:hypothetical protein